MEVMAFLIGAAARLTPSSAEPATAWPGEALVAKAVKDVDTTNATKNWPGHWAVAKYL